MYMYAYDTVRIAPCYVPMQKLIDCCHLYVENNIILCCVKVLFRPKPICDHVLITTSCSVFPVVKFYAASKTSSANGPHLNVLDFDISAEEFQQQKNSNGFSAVGLNSPLVGFILLYKER